MGDPVSATALAGTFGSSLPVAEGIAGAFGPTVAQTTGIGSILANPATPLFTAGEGLTGFGGGEMAAGFAMPELAGGLGGVSDPLSWLSRLPGGDWAKWAMLQQMMGGQQQSGGGGGGGGGVPRPQQPQSFQTAGPFSGVIPSIRRR